MKAALRSKKSPSSANRKHVPTCRHHKTSIPKGQTPRERPSQATELSSKEPLQRRPPQKPSKDELDAQLDSYMSSTKSLLVEETDYSPWSKD
ncbi:Hypothetical protein FKW44_008268 [Caligus rogercresseyi]|uniref:Chromatin target of PRMT1 protein C-terminal domain-containing protein n=1 Tax=Caligus rogercresseyi TaxID=217165 RepID=A0A7T8KFW3_CALRO|nr:Hypothetical protein FKW44_008268 [Caligus rogercresseyi]